MKQILAGAGVVVLECSDRWVLHLHHLTQANSLPESWEEWVNKLYMVETQFGVDFILLRTARGFLRPVLSCGRLGFVKMLPRYWLRFEQCRDQLYNSKFTDGGVMCKNFLSSIRLIYIILLKPRLSPKDGEPLVAWPACSGEGNLSLLYPHSQRARILENGAGVR